MSTQKEKYSKDFLLDVLFTLIAPQGLFWEHGLIVFPSPLPDVRGKVASAGRQQLLSASQSCFAVLILMPSAVGPGFPDWPDFLNLNKYLDKNKYKT